MPRLGSPRTIEINALVSGNKRVESQVRKALAETAWTVIPVKDPKTNKPHPLHRTDDWGFPSYTDPITAEKAGHPNAGHTPGTAHPATLRFAVLEGDHDGIEACKDECEHIGLTEERTHACKHVGQPYARDERIGFVRVSIELPEGDQDAVDAALEEIGESVEKLGWQRRTNWQTQPLVLVDLGEFDPKAMVARIAALEEALGLRKAG